MDKCRITITVEAPEEMNELLLERLVQNDAGGAFRQPTARLDSRERDRDRAVEASFVDPIWQQPCRILAPLIIVDRPVEMHVAVNAGQIGRVPVGTGVPNAGQASEHCIEIREGRAARLPPNDDLHGAAGHLGERAQNSQAFPATDHAEPANAPRWTRRRPYNRRGPGVAFPDYQHLVLHEPDR